MPRTGVLLRRRLQPDELVLVDKSARARGNGAAAATRAVKQRRAARGVAPMHQSAVCRCVKGIGHPAGAAETRGRKRALTPKGADELDRVRKRLLRAANNQYRVTYADAVAAADMQGRARQRACEEAPRSKGVRFRQPRKKILSTEEDAEVRRPKKYWETGVHAWVNSESWVMPLTPKQRAKRRQTLVTGHLRKPSEGAEKGMTKPRQNHSFLGIPSALTLPPRAPSATPLDFPMWKAVERRLVQTAPETMETKGAFLQRLKSCAQKLPKNNVESVIARMRPNMQDIVDADGYAPKND
ncbi:unnamed protein product [Prorocentrum cordatum]|uniref:Uncharacterized protein n=1 Tax=Prorocentrum cordatum TaxID=2364126 RepID=A0ABN9V641_9DINO|nr:unnamed protein product [Polarella glacialis]